MKLADLTGQQFGEWTALEYAGDRKWICRCSCGVEKAVDTSSLKSGRSKNCGHTKLKYDLKDMQFGQLTVLKYTGENNEWICRCSCGRIVIKSSKALRYGKTHSCGNQHNKHIQAQSTEDLVKVNQNTQQKKSLNSNKTIKIKSTTSKIDMIGFKVNDLTVIREVEKDRYLCRCICSLEKEVRGYNLRHPATLTSYTCTHALKLGQRFGKLIILRRNNNDTCTCKCDCGKIKDITTRNIINGSITSCGCNKAPHYSKQQMLDIINTIYNKTGEKPFALELLDYIDVKETTLYEYINNYDLRSYLNTTFGSRYEKYVYDKLNNGTNKIILHDRQVLKPLELDIYIPDKQIAIEINGDYWHSDNIKDPKYHQNKTIECAKKHIRLIHLHEYEFKDTNKIKIIDSLLNGINSNMNVLNARNLIVKEITFQDAKEFEINNHFQGYSNSSINIALIDKYNEIQSIMTLSKPRFQENYDYELIRMCFKLNTFINGGLAKMFNYFKNNYTFNSIVTYVDISKFTGNSYTKIGFKPVIESNITQPGYIWLNPHTNDIKTRYQTQKQKLVEADMGTPEDTEDIIMKTLGYIKIYNSGNLKLEYIN